MTPIIPASEPFATFVNGIIALDCNPFMSNAAQAQQAAMAFAGDPLVGQVLPNTGTAGNPAIAYVDATTTQKLISVYFSASGLDASAVGDGIFAKYVGEDKIYNWSYTRFGFAAPSARAAS